MIIDEDTEWFAIWRVKKHSSPGLLFSAMGHCFRDRDTPNADPDKTSNNVHMASSSTKEAMRMIRQRVDDKRRKDSVMAVEHVMTASPGFWEQATPEQQKDFFKQSMEFLKSEYGEENIIVATIHTDEKSPHLSAFVTPITKDGRLSAKEMVGNKTKLSKKQTEFAKKVEHLGLKRGIEGSKATHVRIQQYYENLNKASQQIPHVNEWDLEPKRYEPQTLIEKAKGKGRLETQEEVRKRINKKIEDVVQPIADKAVFSHTERKNAKKAQSHAKKLETHSMALKSLLEGLSEEQRKHLMAESKRFKQQNQEKIKRQSKNKNHQIGD